MGESNNYNRELISKLTKRVNNVTCKDCEKTNARSPIRVELMLIICINLFK